MAEGFKMGAAFVEVNTKDNTREGRESIGSQLTQWAGGLALGAVISKGITDNLEIGQSTAKLGAQLNLTKDVADQAGRVAGEVYRDNFGQSIPEVNQAIASIGQNLVNLNTVGSEELKGITESAMGIADVFDQDVNEVVRAAGQLVKNRLAPDYKAAFDMITRGFQMGGNIAGDFLETINEYAPQFKKLGFEGKTALGVLISGLKAGARDGDVMADVFKEFGLRAIDTAQLTTDGYKAIGLNADEMRQKVAAGGEGASKAMVEVLNGLVAMKDPVAQNAAGVALFGTQWEDTLRAILPNMDLTEAALQDVEGATAKMNEQMGDTAAAKIEGVKRAMEGWVQTAVTLPGPLGDISAWAMGFATDVIPFMGSVGQIVAGFAMLRGTAVATAIASMASGVKMAAGWFLGFAPIILIGAAVAALVFLVIKYWDQISAFTIKVWSAIVAFLDKIWDSIWKAISDFLTMVVNWVKKRISDVIGFFQMLGSLPGKARAWFSSVLDAAKQKLGDLVNWVKGIPGRIMSAIGNLGRLLWDAGASIIRGLWDGLKSMWDNVTGWLSDVGGWIADLKGPIEVDAVILLPHGNAIMGGLQKGLQTGFDDQVAPYLDNVAGRIADTPMIPEPRSGFPVRGGEGASALGDGGERKIVIENLTITFPGSLNAMSPTDLRAAAEFLRDEIRKVERGQA